MERGPTKKGTLSFLRSTEQLERNRLGQDDSSLAVAWPVSAAVWAVPAVVRRQEDALPLLAAGRLRLRDLLRCRCSRDLPRNL